MGNSKYLACLILLSGCIRYASDPMDLSPSTPYATWTPLQGNRLVSSSFCETMVPPAFDSKNLSLAELIDIGLQNNPMTKQTWAKARAAAAQYGQTLSNFYPDVSFLGTVYRQKATFIDTNSIPQPYFATYIGPDLQLTFTLFDFGQRTAASLAARESLYYADWMHNQEIQTVIQVIMDDYYSYLYQMSLLEAKKADFENAQLTLDAANEKFMQGVAALGDVAQARTQYFQSKMNLTSQKQNVETTFASLAAHLGLPANLPFKVVPLPEEVTPSSLLESIDQLVEIAQTQRQDFLAAQADLRSKNALLLNAKRANLPVFSTSLDVGRYWFEQNQFEPFFHWSAQFTVSFPLFDGYKNRNAIRAAKANVELSEAQLLQTEIGIIQDVTTAHMSVKTAAENLNDSVEYLKSAQLEFKISLENYKAGTATILEVVSAQSNLADAQAKCAGTKRDWFTALAAIAYATGSLCATSQEIPCVQ